MVRKLALAVSLALGTLSVPAHALGLGELSSKSTLNQNFDGDITLLSVKPDELDAVRVKLAEREAFARAGIERPFFLSLLKFEPTLTSRGKSVIRVSSEFPIREPFLNFLIEVNWPNGRLLREYTVLLDPPTTTKRRPPKVVPAAKARQAPAAKARSAAPAKAASVAPAVSADGSEYGPVRANETAWSIAKKVRPGGVSMEQMMMALLDANPRAFIDGNINRLRKGQILRVPALSEIQKLSRQQAREAYREQQDQWLARRNEKLQRAARSQAEAESAAEGGAGAAEPSDQLRIATARPEGEGEAGAGVGAADEDASSPEASDLTSRLIVARENAETSRQEAETLRTRVDDLQARLSDMQKLLSLKDDQLAQLQDRVVTEDSAADEPVAPQDTLAAVEQVMPDETAAPEMTADVVADVADAQAPATGEYLIEDIPAQIDPDLVVEGVGIETGVPADSGIQDIPPQIDPDLIVEGIAASPEEEIVVAPDASAAEPATGEVPAGDEVILGTDAAGVEIVVEVERPDEGAPAIAPVDEIVVVDSSEAQVAEPIAAEPVATEPAAQPDAPESLIPQPLASMLEKNMMPIAAGGVLLFGLFGWLFARGRRKGDAAEALIPQAAVASAGTAAAGVAEAAELPSIDEPALDPDALSDLPDSSFLDEFSPSEINTLQDETGEVDPVSEADVYIAYGRYQQAEEMLRQAMTRDPDRLALKHKLLEVHYATRNAEEFSTLAQEMVDAGQDSADEPAWARAQDMGRELAPENPLFALKDEADEIDLVAGGGSLAAATGNAAAAAVDDDTLALDDLELSELSAEFDAEKNSADDLEAPSEVSIMLDVDEPSAPAEPALPDLPESIQLDDMSALDFDLPEAESDTDTVRVVEENDTTTDSLNLDSMLAQAEAAVDTEDSMLNLDSEFSADELQAQLDELSDLSVLDSELEATPTAEVVEAPAGMGLVEEDSGISASEGLDQPLNLDAAFDAEDGEDNAVVALELDTIGESSEPVSEDEVATKLDLARAYVEMGDEDGARSILEEVVIEGNSPQRADAETLLGKLG